MTITARSDVADQGMAASQAIRSFAQLRAAVGRTAEDEPNIEVTVDERVGAELAGVAAALGRSPHGAAAVDERYRVVHDGALLRVRAVEAEGAFRGLVRMLLMDGSSRSAAEPSEERAADCVDGPGISWRGLSVDTVRYPISCETICRLIDLLALHGMNVLHLHLTDNQAWRAPVPEPVPDTAGTVPTFSPEELHSIVAHAERRFITVVPELDMPGHVAALLADRPELVDPAQRPLHPALSYLDPAREETVVFVRRAIAELIEYFPGSYVHIGADEAFGMPSASFARFVDGVANIVREQGRIPIGWQEAVRATDHAGLRGVDVHQWWMAPEDVPSADELAAGAPPEAAPLVEIAAASYADAREDPLRLAERKAEVIVSAQDPLYLDRRYAEESLLDEQSERRNTLGFAAYSPTSTSKLLLWNPGNALPDGTRLAGVEAAIWAETIDSDDDLAFLLLPRLALVAEAAWEASGCGLDAQHGAERRRKVVAAAAHAWDALGFGGYYRSSHVFRELPQGAPARDSSGNVRYASQER